MTRWGEEINLKVKANLLFRNIIKFKSDYILYLMNCKYARPPNPHLRPAQIWGTSMSQLCINNIELP